MTPKEIALELYQIKGWRQRQNRIKELPDEIRHLVKAYLDNLARSSQDDNRRRNAHRAGFNRR